MENVKFRNYAYIYLNNVINMNKYQKKNNYIYYNAEFTTI